MGSPIIGRSACPECGFAAAHVKRSPKCLYRHCPECGAMYHATGATREAALMAKTRLDAAPSPPEPTPTPTPAPATKPPAPAPKRPAGIFGI